MNEKEPGQTDETGSRKDPLRDLQARVEAAFEEVRPKIRRALDELDERVEEAVRDVRPRAQAAMRDVQPKVDQFVTDVQPRLDSLLSRLQKRIEELRQDLDTRAHSAGERASRPESDTTAGVLPKAPGEAPPGGAGPMQGDATTEGGGPGNPLA